MGKPNVRLNSAIEGGVNLDLLARSLEKACVQAAGVQPSPGAAHRVFISAQPSLVGSGTIKKTEHHDLHSETASTVAVFVPSFRSLSIRKQESMTLLIAH